MAARPLKDQWRYVKLPVTDGVGHEPYARHLKVLAVGEVTVVFGKPKPGKPQEIVMVGTYYIKAVTWM